MDLSNNEVRHIKNNGVEYLEFKAFDDFRDSITAAFVIRGENEQYYCDPDSKEFMVRANNEIGLTNIVQIKEQIHSDKSVIITNESDIPNEVDALLTNRKNIALLTRVADCIAVLAYDPITNTIANIHSGWRGTIKRIAPKTIGRMCKEFGARPENVICVFCPSIGPDHFEVDDDVREIFSTEFGDKYITSSGDKYLIDAAKYVAASLIEVDIRPENIHNSNICTVCHSDLLHSYRASKMIEQKYRNAAIISLK